jgi:hypothetical protein
MVSLMSGMTWPRQPARHDSDRREPAAACSDSEPEQDRRLHWQHPRHWQAERGAAQIAHGGSFMLTSLPDKPEVWPGRRAGLPGLLGQTSRQTGP